MSAWSLFYCFVTFVFMVTIQSVFRIREMSWHFPLYARFSAIVEWIEKSSGKVIDLCEGHFCYTGWIQYQIVELLSLAYTSQGNCNIQYIVFSLVSWLIMYKYMIYLCVVVNWLNLYCTHASACALVPRQLREVFEVRRSNIPTPLVSPHYQFVFHLSPRDLSPGLKMLVKTVCQILKKPLIEKEWNNYIVYWNLFLGISDIFWPQLTNFLRLGPP